ncbi:hypothetical protein [Zhihengliuella flava]|uniref:Intracellular proteinase inhibitor BsuPI domain-containing protein n=1 Tax=Zhihengliuella flava TaxID=1285193 RepID=A0A931DC65_9MICC|nr:hypothetical protein [Zhihengliuella flava]MBG6084841.1 hypothetical protein [Zhihengliuella flava]
MSAPRRPSPAVYRRRRLVVLLAALVVVALLVWGGFAGVSALRAMTAEGRSDASAQPSASADSPASGAESGADSSAEPTESADPSSCQPGDVSVSASTEKRVHGTDEDPVLIMTVENTGDFDCDVNVGTREQEFLIESGDDRIYSTKDCLKDSTVLDITMEPGQKETARFTWERVRSAPGCPGVSAHPRPGTYVFIAKLGNRTSDKAVFELQ